MYLSDLNWNDVPEGVSVLVDGNDNELNFVKNLSRPSFGTCRYEGDECNIKGLVFSYSEGWYNNWTLLERPAKQAVQIEQPLSPEEYNLKVIGDWLHRYATVYRDCYEVGGIEFTADTTPLIVTDICDIRGTKEVIEFINMRYDQLKQAESNKRKQELEDKRLKVLAELSEIDQELGRY